MMVGLLGFRRDAVDEGDRFRKVLEGVLLADRVAVERPAVERPYPAFHILPRQFHRSSGVRLKPSRYIAAAVLVCSSRPCHGAACSELPGLPSSHLIEAQP